MTSAGPDGVAALSPLLPALIENPRLVFQILDMFPIPVQVLSSEGLMVFANRAMLELNDVADASLVVGRYNMKTDPVLNDGMGLRDVLQRAFRGETVVVPDFRPPVGDLVDRGVVEEKPFEAAVMDAFLYPVWDGEDLAYVVNVLIVKHLYQGHPDVARAKEFIESEWLAEFDPGAVARSVNMSVRQLYALFQQHAGMTPGSYYKQVKVAHLKRALEDRDRSIAEVFLACGTDSRGAYARIFKQLTGLSPREYRASLTTFG
jgi:AraC-like DNA-binding protein